MTTVPFAVTNKDGLTIRGEEIHLEGSAAVLPAIIISHGFVSSMEKTRPYAERYAETGKYRCFIFDFCGGGPNSTSDGSFEDYMTPMTELEDLKCVLAHVKSRADVQRIILEGHSQGGFVSSLAAAGEDADAAALLLMYPAFCIPDNARDGQMREIRFDPANIPDHIGEPPRRVCGDYARSVIGMDVYKEIIGYHGPVLICHGDHDSVVPYSYAQRAYDTYKANGNDAELHKLDSDHGFQGPCFDEAVKLAEEFLRRRGE